MDSDSTDPLTFTAYAGTNAHDYAYSLAKQRPERIDDVEVARRRGRRNGRRVHLAVRHAFSLRRGRGGPGRALHRVECVVERA